MRDPVCGTFVAPAKALAPRSAAADALLLLREVPREWERRCEPRDDRRAQLRADIVEVGRRLYARGYTASNDGNISVRLDATRLLMTPKSVCKGLHDRRR